MKPTLKTLALPTIFSATDEAIIAYLGWSYKFAEIAALAKQDILALSVCGVLGITATNEELQAAGDAFRLKHKLLTVSETLAWLARQQITVEDWSQGIRVSLLTQKLKKYLFNEVVDTHYIDNSVNYRRVALSQILVRDLTEALKIVHALREENASFCALALEYFQGKLSKENGGFVGIRCLADLLPEIAQAISDMKEGQISNPIQTKFGYHILRIEKWLPTELNEVREQILTTLLQNWLQEISHFIFHPELHE
ncbi:peptidylprolyl isomerase [Cyanosarcina cf. burmensis CCALA 770]|nr:peptidylprolyl isomerase [Cyanosarcina cf. burmensis CCALA 770]